MKNSVIIAFFATLLMCSCGSEFTSVYKYGDQEAKYEFAKEAFARGKYQQAQTLLMELVTMSFQFLLGEFVIRLFLYLIEVHDLSALVERAIG